MFLAEHRRALVDGFLFGESDELVLAHPGLFPVGSSSKPLFFWFRVGLSRIWMCNPFHRTACMYDMMSRLFTVVSFLRGLCIGMKSSFHSDDAKKMLRLWL